MILIADDSRFMRQHIMQTLRKKGYTNFIEASNGKEAVLFYILFEPNLTLLDITMPEVDGLTALKEIIKVDPSAKVIMCSALGTKQNKAEAKMLGASDFFIKPHFEGLVEKVTKLKNSSRGEYIEGTNS